MADPLKGTALMLSGRKVTIEIFCADDYEAILLHDEIVAKIKDEGGVSLHIGGVTSQKQTIGKK